MSLASEIVRLRDACESQQRWLTRLEIVNAELVKVVERVQTEMGPTQFHCRGLARWECHSCGRNGDYADAITHTADCLWQACAAALAQSPAPAVESE